MADENPLVWPKHDYWMYDEEGELIHLFAWEGYSGPDAEAEWINSPDYEPY